MGQGQSSAVYITPAPTIRYDDNAKHICNLIVEDQYVFLYFLPLYMEYLNQEKNCHHSPINLDITPPTRENPKGSIRILFSQGLNRHSEKDTPYIDLSTYCTNEMRYLVLPLNLHAPGVTSHGIIALIDLHAKTYHIFDPNASVERAYPYHIRLIHSLINPLLGFQQGILRSADEGNSGSKSGSSSIVLGQNKDYNGVGLCWLWVGLFIYKLVIEGVTISSTCESREVQKYRVMESYELYRRVITYAKLLAESLLMPYYTHLHRPTAVGEIMQVLVDRRDRKNYEKIHRVLNLALEYIRSVPEYEQYSIEEKMRYWYPIHPEHHFDLLHSSVPSSREEALDYDYFLKHPVTAEGWYS